MKFYHGGYGKLKEGGMVLPPTATESKSCADFGAEHVCRRDKVYVTTCLDSARAIARFSICGNGKVYEVEPIGELHPDPDCNEPGLSWECDKARVKRVMPKG